MSPEVKQIEDLSSEELSELHEAVVGDKETDPIKVIKPCSVYDLEEGDRIEYNTRDVHGELSLKGVDAEFTGIELPKDERGDVRAGDPVFVNLRGSVPDHEHDISADYKIGFKAFCLIGRVSEL